MIDRFRISAQLPARLREYGLALPALLRHAGLPAGFFQQEKVFATTAELFALWRAVGELSPIPAIGLRLGEETRFERYEPAAIAAVCSSTYRDALERMARYKQLTCPEEIRVEVGPVETSVEFYFCEAAEREPDALVDLCLAWMLAIGRRGTAGRITPLRVELTRAAAPLDILERHYGCKVRLKGRRNVMILRTSDVDRPFVTHNRELLTAIGAQLESELQDRAAQVGLGEQVRHTLRRSLAGKRPTLAQIARELGHSTRTLQRRLTETGHTFQELVEDTRRELARHYLRQSTMELNETAFLLGYVDANSFFRAFHAWEGTTPGEWRQRHAA